MCRYYNPGLPQDQGDSWFTESGDFLIPQNSDRDCVDIRKCSALLKSHSSGAGVGVMAMPDSYVPAWLDRDL